MPQKIQGGDYFLEPTLGLGVTCRKINDPSLGPTPVYGEGLATECPPIVVAQATKVGVI